MKTLLRLLLSIFIVSVLVVAFLIYERVISPDGRTVRVLAWLREPQEHLDWAVQLGERCQGSPFSMPTDGFIGYLWNDSFRPGHHHQGLDIFGGDQAGLTPVVTVYDGYLTRLPEWKSTVIVRIPDDPLHPGRQIWTYYTHMADASGTSYISSQFPLDTQEVFVPAGTPIGYQGNYSGDLTNPVGVHLHFSIVRDDGQGKFMNELEIENTIDPSPYFNLPLNGISNPEGTVQCNSARP